MPREVNTPLLLTGAAATPTDPRHVTPKDYVDRVAAPVAFVDTAIAYTAKPGEYVLADATNGSFTVTLSSGTSGVKKVDTSSNVVTVVAASGNTIGSLGATSFPLRLTDQALVASLRGTNYAITHGYQSLQALDARYLTSSRVLAVSTTALPNEALWVSAAGGARTIAPCSPAPPAGTEVYFSKTDTSTNPVTWVGALGNDPDGVRLWRQGDGATMLFDGTTWWNKSTASGVPAQIAGRGGGGAPTAMGARTGGYNAARNLYVPGAGAALRAIRGHIGRAATGALVDVVFGGDSKTAGYNIGSQNSYCAQMRARLTAAGIPSAGTGLVMAANGATDSRIAQTGTWTASPPFRQWGASGATCTFTSDVPGTVVEVYYYSNSGNFSVSIDGAAGVAVVPPGGSTIQKYTVTGLGNTTHTVTVTASSAAGYLIGFCVRGTTGVLLHSIAISGYTTGQYAATGFTTLANLVNYLNPSIFGLNLGVNDYVQSVTPATMATNLTTILSTNHPTPAKLLIAPSAAAAATADQWAPYAAAIYDRADALPAPLLDLTDRFGTPDQALAAGLTGSDKVHETVAGANDIARALTGLFAA